eukprot:3281027-Rhodomonas_salina.2
MPDVSARLCTDIAAAHRRMPPDVARRCSSERHLAHPAVNGDRLEEKSALYPEKSPLEFPFSLPSPERPRGDCPISKGLMGSARPCESRPSAPDDHPIRCNI